MKSAKVINLTKEDLKKILCKHFNLQEPNCTLKINVIRGDRPFDPDQTEIKLEAEQWI